MKKITVIVVIIIVLIMIVLFLTALSLIKFLLSNKDSEPTLFHCSQNTKYRKSEFDIEREAAEKRRIAAEKELEKELEERRNWKPSRSKVFIPSFESATDENNDK